MSDANASYDEANIFAKILRGELPAHRVHEDDETLVFMDIMPRADGHSLVIPKRPGRNLLDLDADAVAAVAKVAQRVARAAMTAFGADGVIVQQFNEAPAGQEVFHYHVHVVPRYNDVPLRPRDGTMADGDVLKAQAEKLAAAMRDG